MILALAGEEPELVQATGGYYLHKKIADVTTTHLDFPSGLKAHIFVSWLHPFKEQKLVVVGDKKMAVFDDTQPLEDKLLLYPHQIIWENNIPVPAKAEAEKVPLEQGEPLKTECQEFLTCMGNGHRPTTDGREGLRVLKVLKAAQEALDNPGLGNSGIEGLRDSEIKGPRGKGQGPRTEATDNASQITDNRSRITDCFVHDTAVVDEPAEIGAGTKIWHFSHVLKNSRIGEKSNIGQNVVIGPDVTIGNQCKIQNNVSVYKGVTLEDGVFCGPSMVFTNIYNPRAEMSKMDQVRPTLVKHGATLGANCTIVCGATIGKYAFVGAGAVVTRDVPDHALVVGNPARQVGWMCVCGEKLSEDGVCESCGFRIAN
jgi:UDP-2-acetamido-3-amino-2,3-dideoxy-glucuronate N-acetyltransferase